MEERPPYSAYAAIMGAFAGSLATTGVLARLLGREPGEHSALDLLTLVVAKFKAASHARARDELPAGALCQAARARRRRRDPAEGGMRQAIGELVTCTRCVGTWTAGGLAATQVLWPRFGRLVTWTLAAAGANDFLQTGFSAKANELER